MVRCNEGRGRARGGRSEGIGFLTAVRWAACDFFCPLLAILYFLPKISQLEINTWAKGGGKNTPSANPCTLDGYRG
jgi:hypothetical protein